MLLFAAASSLALCATPLPRVPLSPDDMVQRASKAVSRAAAAGVLRQTIKLVVPDDTRTYKVFGAVEIAGTSAPEDLDPWPGGLKQQFPIALGLGREVLQGVTGASERTTTDQVLDAEDACGLILAQGETPADDAACVLFAGCDQMDQLAKVDAMASGRLLCLLNPQFKRLEDFSLWQRGKAKSAYFDKGYEVTYAFEEFACRGEDVKLVGEYGLGWRAFVLLDDKSTEGLPLHEGCLPERPDYKWLEAQINEQHPEPRWARMLGEVEAVAGLDKALRKEMEEAQADMCRWITDLKQTADTVVLQAQRTLDADKENIASLQDELDAVDAADEDLQKQAADERRRAEELRRELDGLAMQEGKLPPEQQRLRSQLEQQAALVQSREAACNELLSSKNLKLSELHKGAVLYSARLGLTFERVGDERLRLIFTNVDERSPAREFSFQVFVDGSDKYHVERCEPTVPAMAQLLETLNTANDFSAFVRSMRKEFKKGCC